MAVAGLANFEHRLANYAKIHAQWNGYCSLSLLFSWASGFGILARGVLLSNNSSSKKQK